MRFHNKSFLLFYRYCSARKLVVEAQIAVKISVQKCKFRESFVPQKMKAMKFIQIYDENSNIV